MDLKNKHCVPCHSGAPVLKGEELEMYMKSVDTAWVLHDGGTRLIREFVFNDFAEALAYVNKVGEVAEQEDHHPDVCLYDYKRVRITIWTHKIGGLHENDFILAAKIDSLAK